MTFPSNPTVGDKHTIPGGVTYEYQGNQHWTVFLEDTATTIVSTTAPDVTLYREGKKWFNPDSGLERVLHTAAQGHNVWMQAGNPCVLETN